MSGRRQVWAAAVTVGTATVAHLWLQAGVMLGWTGFTTSYFRNYYWSDQLAYLGIAANVAHGAGADVEPYTTTGSIYYPRAHYVVLGALARLTDTHPATMWLVCGLLVQALLVVAIGVTTVLLTRRWWTGLVAFVPFVLGTGSWLRDRGWSRQLDSHAVLWGPGGVMYTLNGETVALSIGGVALLALLLVAAGRIRGRAAWVVALLACLAAGATANVQTYGFLTTVYVLVAATAAVGLVRHRSWIALAATGGLLVLLFVVGPVVADGVSPLAALALGLLPAVPGVLLVLRETRWWGIACVAALGLGAAPQVLATALGLLGRDDFLVYRESSSKNLGVPPSAGLWAALAVLPVLALVIALGVRHRRVLWVAVPSALLVTWALLASNDHWGANQEPYRLWLDTYVLTAVLVVPLGTWAWTESLLVSRTADERTPADPVERVGVHRGLRTTEGRVVAGLVAVCVVVAGLWSLDFRTFRSDTAAGGYLAITSPGYLAAAELADLTDGGIVLTDACIDPVIFKPVWGGPVAYYNPGLAWPGDKEAIDAALAARAAPQDFDQELAMRGGVRWLLVNEGCELDLTADARAEFIERRTFSDDGRVEQTLALWALQKG
ncbi:hypothetical protein [Cellulomonas wangsupingiae]|uniref:hypothetical protein n=1 Tax=Cellulomonas wangsupingiae TaxID=2968085 RepID=UPI001D0EBF98|nr:hypothetical protein [Cellulomonas wangsupingiae]MCM0640334.1 hypothetical protein [Cellulomonas wangsupingiae]